MTRILTLTAIGILLSTSALARVIHPPMPTKEHPGDAPADGITEPKTIVVDPSAADATYKFPEGSTIISPERRGRERTPEVLNPPPSVEDNGAAPVGEVTERENGDPHTEEDVNEPDIYTEDNGIRFVSGGIGEHDIAHMKKLQSDFKLKLEFSASSGHYLSGVTVTLTNKDGEAVLTMTTEGPTLLVDLPEGAYTVTATYENAVQTKKVTTGKALKGYTVVFTQPVS